MLTLSLAQGLAGKLLEEIPSREKVLFSDYGSGRTHLMIHCALSYWRRTKKGVIILTNKNRMIKWIRGIKAFEEGIHSYQDDDINTLYLEGNICIVPTLKKDKILKVNPFIDRYGLIIVDDENTNLVHPTIETIFLRRPHCYIPRLDINLSVRISYHYTPDVIYDRIPIYMDYSSKEKESCIKRLLDKYKIILIILASHSDYEDEDLKLDFTLIKDENTKIYRYAIEDNDSKVPFTQPVIDSHKKCIIITTEYTAINSTFHVPCIVHYRKDPFIIWEGNTRYSDIHLFEAERSVICSSNPYPAVYIKHIFYTKDKVKIKENLTLPYFLLSVASRIIIYHIGRYAVQELAKYTKLTNCTGKFLREMIKKRGYIMNMLKIPFKNPSPLGFVATLFPFMYRHIKRIEPIDRFDLYERIFYSI